MRTCRRRRALRHLTAGSQGGFTLLELLVVVAVLGVLSGVVVFAMGAMADRAEQSACAADERVLVTALEAHSAISGAYGNEDELVAAGHLGSTSSSHDVVLTGDGYSLVATGECAAGSSEEVAGAADLPTAGVDGDAPAATTTTMAPTTTTTTTTAPAATGSISSITSVRAVNLSTNTWRATATVRVTDDLGSAVTGAAVTLSVQQQSRTGTWTALAGASGSTDGSGVVAVSSVEVHKYPVPRIRFRVSSVSAPGLAWQQNDAWSDVAKP